MPDATFAFQKYPPLDPLYVDVQIDNILQGNQKSVQIPLVLDYLHDDPERAPRITSAIITGYSVYSLDTTEVRTSGNVASTSFDFYLFDSDKGTATGLTLKGLQVQDKTITAKTSLQTNLEWPYKDTSNRGVIYATIKNTTGSPGSDFDLRLWFRPLVQIDWAALQNNLPAGLSIQDAARRVNGTATSDLAMYQGLVLR